MPEPLQPGERPNDGRPPALPPAARHGGKVFGVGLPKTGTSSLNRALEILGYRSCHFPHDDVTVAELKAAHYRLSILERYDALTDVPVPAVFAQLDAAWPGSRFVLTVRERGAWLDSCRHAPFNHPEAAPEAGSVREFYRVLLYGCVAFDEGRFAWVYDRHLRAVAEHFAGARADQLLVLDVAGGEGWETLCPFLGVPVPDVPFPHANARSAAHGGPGQPEGRTGQRLRRLVGRLSSGLTGRRRDG